MANTKISALPASTTPLAGTEVLPIVQSSTTKQVSVANLTAGRAVATGALTVTGAATVSSTLGVTGAATLSSTLGVTGATTLSSLVTTTGTISTTPSGSTDIANKAYVDTVAQGLDTKASVVAGTTANITLSGTQTVDGVVLVAADRVLVKNQTTTANNGLYLCAAGSWTRTTDMDTWAEVPGAYVFVEQGTTLADTGWVCTSDAGGTIGVTAIVWAQFSGAGSGVSSINFGTTGLTPSSVTTGAVTVAGTLAVLNGGTGVTTSTGTTNVVLSNSPTLVTPNLGTPSFLVGTSITGTATAFTASNVTTNANLTGDVTSVGNATTLTNAPVIAKVLTGYTSGAGTVAATDSILQAIQKLNGNDATNANLTGAVTSVGNATSLGSFTSSQLLSALTDETGTGVAVFATNPVLTTPNLGTPTTLVLTAATGLPLTTGVSGQLPVANGGTGTATPSIVAGTNVTVTGTWPNQTIAASSGGTPGGSTTQVQYNNAGVFGGITGATTNGTALTLVAPVLGTPASGTVTNLTGTASININGTVGATSATTGAFTTVNTSGTATLSSIVSSNLTLSGGSINGTTVGAVTPSTGAFTTGTFNGAVTYTGAITNPLVISGQTTNYFQITGHNTGGEFRLGVNNSAGNQLGNLIYSTVFGSITATPIEFIADNATRMTISSSGAIRFNSGYGSGAVTSDASGNLTIASDEAIKTSIEPFTRGLKEIVRLSKSNATITYKYNEESGLETKHRYAGFSANIVETIIPEAVGESGTMLNGKMLRSISDRPIIAALVNAIAEQQAQIDELRRKLL